MGNLVIFALFIFIIDDRTRPGRQKRSPQYLQTPGGSWEGSRDARGPSGGPEIVEMPIPLFPLVRNADARPFWFWMRECEEPVQCRKPHCRNGVVDTFRLRAILRWKIAPIYDKLLYYVNFRVSYIGHPKRCCGWPLGIKTMRRKMHWIYDVFQKLPPSFFW